MTENELDVGIDRLTRQCADSERIIACLRVQFLETARASTGIGNGLTNDPVDVSTDDIDLFIRRPGLLEEYRELIKNKERMEVLFKASGSRADHT